ncbi:hypothetical protein PFISCL1PPCAC_18549, partial [Pristionchus fissidentatus]
FSVFSTLLVIIFTDISLIKCLGGGLALDNSVGGGVDEVAVGGHTGVHSCLALLGASLAPRDDTVLEPGSGGSLLDDGSAGVSLARVNSLLAGAELDLLDDLSGVLLLASGQVYDGHVSLAKLAGDLSLFFGGSPSGDPEHIGVADLGIVVRGKADGLDVVSEDKVGVELDEGDIVVGLAGVVLGVEVDGLDGHNLLCVFVALGLVEDSSLDLVALGVQVIVDAVSGSHDPSGGNNGSSALERADLVGQPALGAPDDLPGPGVGDGDVSTDDLGAGHDEVGLDGSLTATGGQGHGERGEKENGGSHT